MFSSNLIKSGIIITISLLSFCLYSKNTYEPLDPLSEDEIRKTVSILKDHGKIDSQTKFETIDLNKPKKKEVYQFIPGSSFNRSSYAVFKTKNKTYEAIIDITKNKIATIKFVPKVQPAINESDYIIFEKVLYEDKSFLDLLKKRGISNPKDIFCDANSTGYFPNDKKNYDHKLLNGVCYLSKDTNNTYARPIEGFYITIDLNQKKLVYLSDTKDIPLIEKKEELDEESIQTRPALNPIVLEAPLGEKFSWKSPNRLNWQNFSIHLGFEKRSGLILSDISYMDQKKKRNILYQGSLSEIFVPYMDPDPSWYWRSFFDVGEYHIGYLASSLDRGADCPNHAVYKDAVLADVNGSPYIAKDVMRFPKFSGLTFACK